MESLDQPGLSATFAALSDPTRRAIIARLVSGEVTLGALASPFDMSQSAVTKHVGVLADAGLVAVEKRGRTRHCRLIPTAMGEAFDWLKFYHKFWDDQFTSLAAHLDKADEESDA